MPGGGSMPRSAPAGRYFELEPDAGAVLRVDAPARGHALDEEEAEAAVRSAWLERPGLEARAAVAHLDADRTLADAHRELDRPRGAGDVADGVRDQLGYEQRNSELRIIAPAHGDVRVTIEETGIAPLLPLVDAETDEPQ